MEVTVGTAALALALLLLPLLYERCGSFRFFCKMGFYNGWILLLALLAIPLCALRGRDVENMKIIRGLMQHVKRLYGIRMVVRGAHNFPPRQPYVVVSNHQSSLDLLGMMEVLPDRCVPIAKRELLYMGAVGVVCWLGGIIFIDRKRTHDAISVMAEAAHTMLSQDVRVWVFPEGTRNHSGSMLPFKRGAFHLAVQAQVPVVPIVISSYQHFYSKRERRFTAGRCLIQVLPPLPTRGMGAADVPALTERVRAAMLDAFERLSAELRSDHGSDRGSDQSDQQSDHTEHRSDQQSDQSDQRDTRSDQSSDRGSDHRNTRSDRRDTKSDHQSDQSDHKETQSDHQSDHQSDQRDTQSDHQSDQSDRRDTKSDHKKTRSDPWSDPKDTQSDQKKTWSDPRDTQSYHRHSKSDHRSDRKETPSDPQSDHKYPKSDPWSDLQSDPWSDPGSDQQRDPWSDHTNDPKDPQSDPKDPGSDPWSDHTNDPKDTRSDPQSDPQSDRQRPAVPGSDPPGGTPQ